MSAPRKGRGARAARADKAPKARAAAGEPLGLAALAAVAGFGALLLLAPPASNWFWAVNGLRSLGAAAAFGLVAVAALASLAPLRGARGRWLAAGLAIAVALALAFPLREKIHLLGDTLYRIRAMHAVSLGLTDVVRLLANPLDLALDVWGTLFVRSLKIPLGVSISLLGVALGLVYSAGIWRLTGRLGAPPELRLSLALAIGLTGVLQAFAGYAEVAGLVAATAIWWWAELIAPLRDGRQAWRVTIAFLVLLLGHRIAVVAILPQLVRALGPPAEGDRLEARRLLAILTVAAIALAVAAAVWAGLPTQLARDVADLIRSAKGEPLRPSDSLNGLVLVAPLALLAPFLAGRRALSEWLRSPVFLWVAVASAPLLVGLAWVFPLGQTSLGAHRDWDANILLGVSLTVGAASLLARVPAARLRRALAATLPVLAVGALGWVAVNASEPAALARAIALGREEPKLPAAQLAYLHDFFGQRGMNERSPALAARHYEMGYEVGGNPRRLLLASEAWLVSGDREAARRALARARARGPLNAELETSARELERLLGRDTTATP